MYRHNLAGVISKGKIIRQLCTLIKQIPEMFGDITHYKYLTIIITAYQLLISQLLQNVTDERTRKLLIKNLHDVGCEEKSEMLFYHFSL